MKKIFGIFCLACVFASCEKVIEPGELPEQDVRLVINAILDKDSVFSVNLSQSKSIISGKDYKMVDKEVCEVYEDGVFLEKLSFVSKGKYLGIKKPSIGKTYRIVAKAANLADAEGSSKLPAEPVLIRCERIDSATVLPYLYDGITKGNTNITGGLNYKIQLKDNADISDYYNVSIRVIAYDSAGTDFFDMGTLYLNDLSNSQSSNNASFYYNGLFGSDQETVIGSNKVFSVGSYLYSGDLELKRPITLQPILTCTQFSAEYYQFMLTASKQITTGAGIFVEPTVIYSNCSNGMGIVGGRVSKTFLLNPIILK
jgi:hypothetical protein